MPMPETVSRQCGYRHVDTECGYRLSPRIKLTKIERILQGDFSLISEAGLLKRPSKVLFFKEAGPTGLEPATSGVTGRCSNQLNYGSILKNQ